MCQESPRPTGPFCFITGERASQVALVIRNPPADAEDIRETDLIPESGRSLEKNMATHSRVLDWRIPWQEEPGGLQPTGLQSAEQSAQT